MTRTRCLAVALVAASCLAVASPAQARDMTVPRMEHIWDWFTPRVQDAPDPPGMRIREGPAYTWWVGLYTNDWVNVRPWARRRLVVHEFAHYVFDKWQVDSSPEGSAFLYRKGFTGWTEYAQELWCNKLASAVSGDSGAIRLMAVWLR